MFPFYGGFGYSMMGLGYSPFMYGYHHHHPFYGGYGFHHHPWHYRGPGLY